MYSYGSLAVFCPEKWFFHCVSMQRFVSKRSSSSVDLDSSSLDDVQEFATSQAAVNVFCRSTSSSNMSSHMVSAYSGLAGGNQETPRPPIHTRGDRPRQHSSRPGHCTRRRRAQRHRYEAPQNPRRHRARLVPRRDGPVEDGTAMGRAAVLG